MQDLTLTLISDLRLVADAIIASTDDSKMLSIADAAHGLANEAENIRVSRYREELKKLR